MPNCECWYVHEGVSIHVALIVRGTNYLRAFGAGQTIAVCVEQYPHLTGLELADSSSGGPSMSVDILIGSDYYWHLVTGDICRGVSGPVAVHTKLGWVLSGPTSQNTSDPELSVTNLSVHVLHAESQPVEPSKLEDQLRAFWELEALGIQDKEKTLYDEFASAVKFENGRYKISLPWKEFRDPLPDNYYLCVSRLQGLLPPPQAGACHLEGI